MYGFVYLGLVGNFHQMAHKCSRLGALRITHLLHLQVTLCENNVTSTGGSKPETAEASQNKTLNSQQNLTPDLPVSVCPPQIKSSPKPCSCGQ